MEQRLSLVTLGVADLDQAIEFYTEVIGWTRAPGPPGVAFFDLGGIVLSLYPRADLARDLKGNFAGRGGDQSMTLAHNVRSESEVDAIFARLNQHGTKIIATPERVFWGGYVGYFADPDGHIWEVAHNPHWTIEPDGRIRLSSP